MSQHTIEEEDRQLVVGALDTLSTALAHHGHVWTDGETTILGEALRIMGVTKADSRFNIAEDDDPGEQWKKG